MSPKIEKFLEHKERIRKRMWKTLPEKVRTRERFFYATLRVATITIVGIKENRLLNRAAALSFSSLIGLIPMIAIIILVSGFALEKTDPDLVVNNIHKGISYIAPQLSGLDPEDSDATNQDGEGREQLKVYLQEFVDASQSGAVGISGIIALILIVMLLFSSIEGALNDIWEIKQGRSLMMKVGMYWTVITLGTLLAGAGIAMLAAYALKWNSFASGLPGGANLELLIEWGTKCNSFLLLSTVLAAFYHFIPNTIVSWRASFIGAVFTLSCIILNHSMAFAYSSRVTLDRSLYGSLAMIPVLMMAMFIFWFFILLGGRVTYAVQNAQFKGENILWDQLSHASRESISLLLFSKICRRFRDCHAALSSKELSESSKLPVQFVNASLTRLCELNLVSLIPPEKGGSFRNYKYQPARPLDRIELNVFKSQFDNHGKNPHENHLDDHDPIVKRFHSMLEQARKTAFSDLTIEDVIELSDDSREKPDSESSPGLGAPSSLA